MSAGHTPGPWAVSKRRNGRRVTANGVMLCTALLQNGPGKGNVKAEEEAIANARLIAEAPELVRNLQNMVCALDAAQSDGAGLFAQKIAATRAAAIAAIAKATGAQS